MKIKTHYQLNFDVDDYATKDELMNTLKGVVNLLFDKKFGEKITEELIFFEERKYQINHFTLTFNKCNCEDIFPFEPNDK